MARFDLSDAEWRIIEPLLPNKPRGVARVDDRRVLNGIFYILRTGSPWRDLPEVFGHWNAVHQRFERWKRRGVFERMFAASAGDADLEYAMIDGTIVKGAPCSGHRTGQGARGDAQSGHRSLQRRSDTAAPFD